MEKSKDTASVYALIYKELCGQIFSGALQSGDMLPSENQLCMQFDTSRETVRKALKMLEGKNLIYSKPKIGYFINQPNHVDLTVDSLEGIHESTQSYWDVHGILPDEYLQEKLNIAANRKVMELTQIYRDQQERAVAAEIKYIPYERAYPSVEGGIRYATLPDVAFAKLSSYEYVCEVEISAATAPQKVADMLGCEEGTPLLLIERVITRQDGSRIAYSKLYRAPQFSSLHATTGFRF